MLICVADGGALVGHWCYTGQLEQEDTEMATSFESTADERVPAAARPIELRDAASCEGGLVRGFAACEASSSTEVTVGQISLANSTKQ